MNRTRKLFITMIVAAMMVSLAAPAFAQSVYSDVSGHWAESGIERWQAHGVIQGYPDGSFRPNEPVTRAEFVTILNGIFGFYAEGNRSFADVPAEAWYAKGMAVARQAGYYEGFPGNLARPSEALTRQDAAALLARMFALEPEAGTEKNFADQASIAPYAAEAVQALAGNVSGYPDGTFRPSGLITRAEVVQLMNQLIAGFFARPGEVEGGTISGNAVINQKDVVLKNATILGNLYIAPGVADGDAALDAVTVEGTTFLSGGGEHTVGANDSTFADIEIERKEGALRFQTSGPTTIDSITVRTPATLELGEGTTVKKVVIYADGTQIVGDGSIEVLIIEADGVTVNGEPVERGETSVGGGTVGFVPGGGSSSSGGGGSRPDRGNNNVIDLVDKDATPMTQSLFAYLLNTQGKQIIFGQQHVTDEALSDAVNADGVVSDVYNSVGDYPGLFGWDTLSLDGYEKPGSTSASPESNVNALIAEMKRAHDLGGILTLSMHPRNFVTGGAYNDVSGKVVDKILPGGSHNAEFNAWLDNIAAFANGLVDEEGRHIPVLFRPFHEQSGGWFWWGTTYTTVDEYKELYRYTVEYLRDKKDVHNFLYVYSPNGPFGGNAERFLTWYPGDDYVDVLGLDQYDNKDNAGSEGFLNGLVEDLGMISRLAEEKGKISAFSEFGYSPQGMNKTGNNPVWFTSMLNAIKADPDARKIAYMQTWANFGFPTNVFVPYRDVKLVDPDTNEPYGDSDLLPDFIDFYEDSYTAFSRDLVGVYDYKANVKQDKPSFMHVVSPLEQQSLKEETLTIRARVLHADHARVTYSVNDSEEVEMTLDEEGFYYMGSWTPDATHNGTIVEVTVRLYENGWITHESTKLVQVQVPEILIDTYTFDDDLEGVAYAGAYYNAIGGDPGTGSIEHAVIDGNGVLQLNVTDMVYTDSWQELKLELKNIDDAVLRLTNRVKFEVMVPVDAGSKSADAQVQGVGLLPPDYGTKYEAAGALLSSLTVTNNVYKYEAVVTFPQPQKLEEAEGIALSIVGKYLEHEGPIYVDNIAFYRAFMEEPDDPAIVDTFEGYQGLDALLRNAYTIEGDNPVILSLSPDVKGDGHFGLRYEYDLDREYVGITKALNTDWSSFNKLRFWLKPDGSGQKLVLQFTFSGIAYEAYPSLEGTEEGWVDIHLNDFVPAQWETAHQGRALTKKDLQNVTKFGLFINLQPGESDRPASVIYIDEIQAIYDESADEVPGDGPPPLAPGLINDFEEDRGGWAIEHSVNNANARELGISTDDPASGSASLSVTFDLDGTDFEIARVEGLNISKVDTLQLKAKLSNGFANAVLYLKDSDYGWHATEPVALSTETYTTLSLPIDKIPGPEAIYAIGVKLSDFSGTGSAKLYIDDVELLAEGSGGTAPGILHDFEIDVEGWQAVNASGGPWVTDEWAASGSQSLKADIPLGSEINVELKSTANRDFSGLSALKAQVKQASWGDAGSGIKAKLFVKTGAGWAWADSGEASLNSDSGTELTIDLTAVSDLDQVKEIGIEIIVPADSADDVTAVYVDHVVLE
ncbi:beta-mannosidase [Xylanibacillus composti]|uniref:Mannan endo-1,4-beta-mannosidase n=1 Tax=Xylanibacillus composti TaxID=1572762 RepID=A0A8J4H156_9BACL|nr:glycosyl hydrolase [Xylanibacillus composti]MDT9725759.1 beta-mannosidase [Xylanibacillus composti]GIQ67527.1 hypothetical protein XYCOK13_03510 [Xylanibacillus composti]